MELVESHLFEGHVLGTLLHHHEPFPFFHCADTFSAERCADLRTLFDSGHEWQAREEDFYRCFLRDVSEEVPAALKKALVERMRETTGLPLTEHVHVTAQRMERGQWVGVHSDQPLLGYEIARLVVQLNRDWAPERGGLLELMAEQEGPAVRAIEPRENHSFGFVLHPKSFHGVTEVSHPRWSVVFNFWHPANTPELALAVEDWTTGLDFSVLPKGLEPLATEAEARLPEETTYAASLAAWILLTWGYEDATIADGYGVYVGVRETSCLRQEAAAAIRLAGWVATLRQGHFSVEEWGRLRAELGDTPPFERLREVMKYCLPPIGSAGGP